MATPKKAPAEATAAKAVAPKAPPKPAVAPVQNRGVAARGAAIVKPRVVTLVPPQVRARGPEGSKPGMRGPERGPETYQDRVNRVSDYATGVYARRQYVPTPDYHMQAYLNENAYLAIPHGASRAVKRFGRISAGEVPRRKTGGGGGGAARKT